MGQQQLLLLVLSTVIVGLATVAGIQAFSENQAQATQDALTQKGVSIASDVKGLLAKPQQLGGVKDSAAASPSDVASSLGYEDKSVSVDGAGGSSPTCTIQSDVSKIVCTSDEAPQDVTVDLNTVTGEVNTQYSGSGGEEGGEEQPE